MTEDMNGSLQCARQGLGYRVSNLTSAPGLKYWFGYFGIGFILHNPNCCRLFDQENSLTLNSGEHGAGVRSSWRGGHLDHRHRRCGCCCC